ncbi:hypothetical protein SK128_009026, partial [Halocaridina rubra]
FKHNASFVTRLPTIRRHRNAHSPSIKNRHTDSNHALENLVNSNRLNASHSEDSVTKDSSEAIFSKKNSDVNTKGIFERKKKVNQELLSSVRLRLAAASLFTPTILSEAGTPTGGPPLEQDTVHFPVVLANLLQKEFGGPPSSPRGCRSPTRGQLKIKISGSVYHRLNNALAYVLLPA